MENLVFTQLSVSEIRALLREELETYFTKQNQSESSKVNNNNDPISVEQAAQFLNLAPPTIYALVSQRKIPHYKSNKRLYFLKDELLNWLKDGRKSTIAEIEEKAEIAITNKRRNS